MEDNTTKKKYVNKTTIMLLTITMGMLVISGISTVYADGPSVVNNISPPTIPSGLKCVYDCDVAVEYGGITYWPFSYIDNRMAINLIGFDSDDNNVYSEYRTGDRYIYSIEVDETTKKVNFLGQNYDIANHIYVWFDWNELVSDNQELLYRLYNSGSGNHLYTISLNEKNTLVNNGWTDEGNVGYVYATQVAGTEPLYRLYNSGSGHHLYTSSLNEKNTLVNNGWTDEGNVGYVFQP